MKALACDGLPDRLLKRAETGFLEALIRLSSPPTKGACWCLCSVTLRSRAVRGFLQHHK